MRMELSRRRGGLLGPLDIEGLHAPFAGYGFKRHRFAFIQGFVTTTQDGGVMHKDILAAVEGDETKALLVVKPLDFAACHISDPVFARLAESNRAALLIRILPLNYFPKWLISSVLI